MTARGKPPHNVAVLQRWIAEHARTDGVAPARLRRWVSFMVIASMLDGARTETGEELFVLKGGVAIELRFALRARATRDYDAAFRGDRDDALRHLDRVLRAGYAEFTGTRGEVEPVGPTGALRTEISLAYRGRPWSTTPLELAPDERGATGVPERLPSLSLEEFGIHPVPEISCLPVTFQIAQKLHAVTTTFTDGTTNDRFRDLLDLQLLAPLVADDLTAVRDACVAVFAQRARHAWPPVLAVPEHWADEYARLAELTAFPVTDVDEAAELVRQLVRDIDHAHAGS